jgi:hypothetical protein
LAASLTTFKHFLSSPIFVNTQDFDEKLWQNQGLVLRNTGDLFFNDCVFDSCVSNSAGGAIQLYADTLNHSFLSLYRCLFHSCTANMHGGAVYALSARYMIVDTCFSWCSARDRQAGLFRGESSVPHQVNQSIISFCGRGYGDRTTLSTASGIIIVVDFNVTYNNVAQWAAGQYLETYRMAYTRFATYCANIGVNVLNYQLRNHEASLDYVNLLNNSAALTWKTLIYANAKAVFNHYYFVQNSAPLVQCDQQMGGTSFVDCVFDVPFDEKLFGCTFSHTGCQFDVENPVPPSFSSLRKDICIDKFAVPTSEDGPNSLIWWVVGLAVCGVGGYVLFFGGPKSKNDEDRVPWNRARRTAD